MTQTQTTYFPQLLSEFFTTSRELQAESCPLLFLLSSFKKWLSEFFTTSRELQAGSCLLLFLLSSSFPKSATCKKKSWTIFSYSST